MLDLYTAGTGNGFRAAIALAESGVPHRVHKIDLAKGEQKTPEFLKRNPAGAIPVLVDSDGPGGKEMTLCQQAPSSSIWRRNPAGSCPRIRHAAPSPCNGSCRPRPTSRRAAA